MKNLTAVCILLSMVSMGCFFSTSSTTVSGTVMNYGKPVEGVEVTFGQTLGEVTMKTGADGKFTLTAKHRFTGMLTLKAKKAGYSQREKIDFPGFAAPTDDIEIEMLKTVRY